MKRYRLKKERAYIILGEKDNKFVGQTNGSLKHNTTQLYSLKKAQRLFSGTKQTNQGIYFIARKMCQSLNKRYPEYKWRVYRLHSKHVPVKVYTNVYYNIVNKFIDYDWRYYHHIYFDSTLKQETYNV